MKIVLAILLLGAAVVATALLTLPGDDEAFAPAAPPPADVAPPPVAAAPAMPPPPHPAATVPRGDLRVVRDFESLTGHHVRREQVVDGVPVYGSEVSEHRAPDGSLLRTISHAYPLVGVPTRPATTPEAAAAAARELILDREEHDYEAAPPRLVLLPRGRSGSLAWLVDTRTDEASLRLFLDATDATPGEAALLRVEDLRRTAQGAANLWDPNPVYDLRDPELRDHKDRDSGRLTSALAPVSLLRLDGSGYLRGDWVDLTPTKDATRRFDHDWSAVTRSDPAFEELMVYHHLDRLQGHLRSLGMKNVNARRQEVDAHGTRKDNSFYDLFRREIVFGDGGVDDGEDADIIRHEYGHAIQDDQVRNFGLTSEGRALGEGFGDFLAAAFHERGDPDWDPLVGSWDQANSGSEAHLPYLRRVDRNKVYPDDLTGKAHPDGEIWSRFLWDLRGIVGRDDALLLSIEGHFLLSAKAGFADAAEAVLLANRVLRSGRDEAEIRGLLEDRAIPVDLSPPAAPPEDDFEENDAAESAVVLTPGLRRNLRLEDEDWFRIAVPPLRRIRATIHFVDDAGNLDLAAYRPDGALVAESTSLLGREEVEAEAGPDGAEVLLRVFPAGNGQPPVGYDLNVVELPLDPLPLSGRLFLELGGGGGRAFTLDVNEPGRRLRVKAKRAGRRGARPAIRVWDPEGRVRHDLGEGLHRRKAVAVLDLDVPGAWTVAIDPREETSGYVRLKARTKR